MDRVELGERLQQWHSSSSDPVYAVGSFYFADQRYPDKSIVEDCLANLESDITKFQKMLAGEKVSVYNSHYGRQVTDLRAFAEYTDEELTNNIADLQEIVFYLKQFMERDYV